jgi:membrane protease YdiL (CAAX protease family)
VQSTEIRKSSDFLDGARGGRNGAGRWVLGILIVVVFWQVIGTLPTVVSLADGRQSGTELYLTLSVTFIAMLFGLWLAVRYVHRRPFGTLVAPDGRFRWTQALRGALYWTVAIAIASLVEWVVARPEYTYTFEPARFLPLLPVVLVLTTIQASSEEFLFRGYLLQGTALLTRRTAVLAAVNGLLFGIPHLTNPEVGAGFALLASYYFLFGVFATLVTLRAGSLHFVIGLHVANNLMGALVVGPPNSALTTNKIFAAPLDPEWNMIVFVLTAGLFWLMAFTLPARKSARRA